MMTFYDVYTALQRSTHADASTLHEALRWLTFPATVAADGSWTFATTPPIVVDSMYHCDTCPQEWVYCAHNLAVMFHHHLEDHMSETPTATSAMDAYAEQRQMLLTFVTEHLQEDGDVYTLQIGGKDTKPSLGKSGSEKLLQFFNLRAVFVKDTDSWDMLGKETGLLCYMCTLVDHDGHPVGEGRGASKLSKNMGDANKAIKMAQKSAQVDATLRYGALSSLFTQDVEDMPPVDAPKGAAVPDMTSAVPPQRAPEARTPLQEGIRVARATELRVRARRSDGKVFGIVMSDDFPASSHKEEDFRNNGLFLSDAQIATMGIDLETPPDIAGWDIEWHVYTGKDGKVRGAIDTLTNPNDDVDEPEIPF